jgi:hypothetical protein
MYVCRTTAPRTIDVRKPTLSSPREEKLEAAVRYTTVHVAVMNERPSDANTALILH